MTSLPIDFARLAAVLRARTPIPLGHYSCVIRNQRIPLLDYATACALYEAARGSGVDAALTSDTELIRRNWGVRQS